MLWYLIALVVAMVGSSYAAVPLYRRFCHATGYGGTVQRREAAVYFNKIQCFCFEEQRLLPGEQIDMPVFFYIDPQFETDPRMDVIRSSQSKICRRALDLKRLMSKEGNSHYSNF